MTTTTFDTHEVYRHIKAVGLSDQQTESLFEAVKVAHSSSELATKGDIKELEYKLELSRRDLIIKVCSIMTGIIVATVGAGVSVILWFIENHGKI